jgi:hypothetical protein
VSNRPPSKKPSAKAGGSSSRATAARRQAGSNRTSWIIVGVVVVIGVAALAAIVATRDSGTSNGGNTPGTAVVSDPAALVSTIAGVSGDTITTVGRGGAALPKPIDAPDLTKDGKPLVVYLGAEYCPFCAAERWAMVQALSRFGTFTGLGFTHSATDDVFPNTATLTFHGSNYQSTVISFTGIETSDADHQPLDTVPPDIEALQTSFNPKGSIPWIDFGGQYVISGASFSPGVLAGKSADQITAALADPGSAITKGIVGAANVITATICILTNNEPSAACSPPAVQDLATQIRDQ